MTLRTIYILWWRQVKIFFRKKTRIIGALGQPILMLFAFGLGFSGLYAQAGQGNFMIFLSAGIIAMTTMMSSMFGGIDIIWDKERGFMKEVLVSPARRINIMIGRMLGGATTGLFQGSLVFIMTLFFGIDFGKVVSLPLALMFMILIALMFNALGIILASLLSDFQGFQLVMNFLIMPLVFLSGAIYPLATTGELLQTIAYLNPLSYGVDGMRRALTGQMFFPWRMSLLMMVSLSCIAILLGAYFFSKMKMDNE